MRYRKLAPALSALFVSVVAIAATFGPFSISAWTSARGQSPSYAADRESEWGEANAFFNSVINVSQPGIKPGDRVRIQYDDGIAEFSLPTSNAVCNSRGCSWATSLPLTFVKVLGSPGERASYDIDWEYACRSNQGSITIQTGYWGNDNYVGDDGTFNIVGTWVSTGSVVIAAYRSQCR